MLQVISLHGNASCGHRSPTGAMDAMCQECHGLLSLGFLGSIAAHLVLPQVAQKKLHLISHCCCFLKERQVSFCPEGYCHWWFEIAAVRVACCNKPPWPRCCPARDTICLWPDYVPEPSLQRNSKENQRCCTSCLHSVILAGPAKVSHQPGASLPFCCPEGGRGGREHWGRAGGNHQAYKTRRNNTHTCRITQLETVITN